MPKKKWTDEERKAAGERLRAAKAKKQPAPTPEPDNVSSEDYKALERQVQELRGLIASQASGQTQLPQTPQIGARGSLVGTYEKYITDKTYYPDPIPLLFEYMESKPELRRLGFKENYELSWLVEPTRYQTIEGVWTSEPRFTVELIGVIYDEETNEITDKRYVMRKLIFHEDPDAAIFVAGQHGVEVDKDNPKEFLNQMRYLRVREWLHDTFFPGKFLPARTDVKEEVIGNKLVTVFTVNSQGREEIPFSQLKHKL